MGLITPGRYWLSLLMFSELDMVALLGVAALENDLVLSEGGISAHFYTLENKGKVEACCMSGNHVYSN